MRILITNDDGIHSPALPELIRWARKHGEVVAVAPAVEQSGKSQAIEFREPVEVKLVDIADDVRVYAMASTPADCVRFGVTALRREYDLIISGVNCGYNLGDDIAYSGTVGAIMEGARLKTKGVAVSTDVGCLLDSIAHLDSVFDFFKKYDLLSHGDLYNVNIPKEPRGFRLTREGGVFFTDDFIVTSKDHYLQVGDVIDREFNDNTRDLDAVKNGYISITPLTSVKTDATVYEKLKNIIK